MVYLNKPHYILYYERAGCPDMRYFSTIEELNQWIRWQLEFEKECNVDVSDGTRILSIIREEGL